MNLPFKAYWDLLSQHIRPQKGRFILLATMLLGSIGLRIFAPQLMRTFIDQVPRELDEAALIDGAGRLRILTQVIVPLVTPGMLAVAVFVVVYAWNEFLFAFIFTATRAKTAPLVISEMIGSIDGVDWGVLFAASTIQLVPVLLFVVLMHRYLIAGLTAGATKG